MSLDSWREEFVICDTEDASNSDLEAIDHALQKFKGLKKKNLKKHNCHIVRGFIEGSIVRINRVEEIGVPSRLDGNIVDNGYILNSQNCALCERHLKTSNCKECPLFKAIGKKCDDSDNLIFSSPYHDAMMRGSPKLMIHYLGKARNKVLGIIDPIHVWGVIAVMFTSLLCGLLVLLTEFF